MEHFGEGEAAGELPEPFPHIGELGGAFGLLGQFLRPVPGGFLDSLQMLAQWLIRTGRRAQQDQLGLSPLDKLADPFAKKRRSSSAIFSMCTRI